MKMLLFGLALLVAFGIAGTMGAVDAQRNAELTSEIRELAKKRDKEPRVVIVDAQGEPQLVSATEAFATAVNVHAERQPVFMEGR